MRDKNRCWKCGSDKTKEHSALLLGKEPYEKECPYCGAELCPKCGHRRSAHEVHLYCDDVVHFFHPFQKKDYYGPSRNNPLQEECAIMTSETTDCHCKYYGCDIEKEMEWNIVPLHEGTIEI
jgi:hypothetical protein